MTITRYDDIDYSIDVPEAVYNHFRDDINRLQVFGESGFNTFLHEIDRAHFRYVNFGRKSELELEIVARTLVAEEVL